MDHAGNCRLEKIGRVGLVDEPFAVHKKSVLLTYQGDFGDFDKSLGKVPAQKDTDGAIHASSGLVMDLIHGNRSVLECTEQVVEVIKQQPRFQVLRASVDKHLFFDRGVVHRSLGMESRTLHAKLFGEQGHSCASSYLSFSTERQG